MTDEEKKQHVEFIAGLAPSLTLSEAQAKVREFNLACGQVVNDVPTALDKTTRRLRAKLLREEIDELEDALDAFDLVEIADALGDILYVAFGAAVCLGVTLPDCDASFRGIGEIMGKQSKSKGFATGSMSRISEETEALALFNLRAAISAMEIAMRRGEFDIAGMSVLGVVLVCFFVSTLLGIDLERVFLEIHRSNMSKFLDGHRREDGKWIKGPSYSPADLAFVLAANP